MAHRRLPSSLPSLPPLPDDILARSANVHRAYTRLSVSFTRAIDLLGQETEPIRLNMLKDDIMETDFALLMALEEAKDQEHLPHDWIIQLAKIFSLVVELLDSASSNTDSRDQENVTRVAPVTTKQSGKRGRPKKIINKPYLQEAMADSRNINKTELAEVLNVHRNTIGRQMKEHGLTKPFSDISDDHLDQLISEFKESSPDDGISYIIGCLRAKNLYIKQNRVQESIRRVDGLGTAIRASRTIKRREYRTGRPNALWHMDGHHKLIMWGIVIHGFIDGYTRMVTGLVASDNNRAETVLDVFLDAVTQFGLPSRMRGDRGGENIQTAVYMIMKRGVLRASYIWGPSTRNTRIERLWVEVGRHFVRAWRGFFSRLERLHRLDRDNSQHIWLLHLLFLSTINKDCINFQEVWNAKPISGIAANKSPKDMHFLGVTLHGLVDECEGLDEETIRRYYDVDSGSDVVDSEDSDSESASLSGVANNKSADSNSEDGNTILYNIGKSKTPENSSADEQSSGESTGTSSYRSISPADREAEEFYQEDMNDLASQIEADQRAEVRHDAIKVTPTDCPFGERSVQRLLDALHQVTENNILPSGFGIREEEWEDEEYPEIETVRVGAKGTRTVDVTLPYTVWLPRAQIWSRALDIMTRMIEIQDREGSQDHSDGGSSADMSAQSHQSGDTERSSGSDNDMSI